MPKDAKMIAVVPKTKNNTHLETASPLTAARKRKKTMPTKIKNKNPMKTDNRAFWMSTMMKGKKESF